jgi:hypothetical protein
MNQNQTDLMNLAHKRPGVRKRASSYDRSGGNRDFVVLEPQNSTVLLNVQTPGMIQHIWMTLSIENGEEEKDFLRKGVIRMWWDDESQPSVEVPIGDFFGMGHGFHKNFVSAPLQMSPQDGRGFNCWFPMPYRSARIEVLNQARSKLTIYYYIDYVEQVIPDDLLRFHAVWHRENPTKGIIQGEMSNGDFQFGGENTSGRGNYVILDAVGAGHYVGCHLNIHNLRNTSDWDWPGEGDDMIFIDGEEWPPSLHGTGTEDYVNMAWCPNQEYQAPYHGLLSSGGEKWNGKITYYRYHILDPILFSKSIRVTIEHGHNNHRSDDWSSTAYWYQAEPHADQAPLPAVDLRLPLDD